MAPALGLGGPSCRGNSNIWGSPGLIYDYSQQHWRFFSFIFFVFGGFFFETEKYTSYLYSLASFFNDHVGSLRLNPELEPEERSSLAVVLLLGLLRCE